jgi:hypothetical protein
LEHFRKGQANVKSSIREEEFKREQKNSTKSQALVDQQDKHFYSYAERCMKEWKDQGKNVTPLILELKKQAKDLKQQ